MNETGFKQLIEDLTRPVKTSSIRPKQAEQSDEKQQQTDENEEPVTNTSRSETPINSSPERDLAVDKENEEIEPANAAETSQDDDQRPAGNAPSIVGSVPLQGWEREALRAYHPLIHTPRGTTRLLNTYRLVRAGVPQSEWAVFSGDKMSDGEFRIAMLLLAAAAGYPAQAREWFEWLLRTPPSQFTTDVSPEDDAAWTQFKSVYRSTFGHLKTPVSEEILNKWIHRVERFAF